MSDAPFLPNAFEIDLRAELEDFLAVATSSETETASEHLKQLTARAGCAVAPAVLALARAAGATGLRSDTLSIQRLHGPDPWHVFLLIEDEGQPGRIACVELEKPITARKSMETSLWIARLRNEELPEKGTPEREFLEKDLLERALTQGFPAELPDPETITKIESFGLYEMGGYSGDASHFVANAHHENFYWSEKLYRVFEPRSRFEDSISYFDCQLSDPAAWSFAHGSLDKALRIWGDRDSVKQEAETIASYPTRQRSTGAAQIHLERLGAALALCDDGLPSVSAKALCDELEARSFLVSMAPRIEDLRTVIEHSLANDLTTREKTGLYNDLDIAIHVIEDGANHLVHIDDQGRTSTLRVEGFPEIHTVTIWTTDDEAAPGDPGHLGTYQFGNRSSVITAPAPLTSSSLRRLNGLPGSIEPAAIEIGYDTKNQVSP